MKKIQKSAIAALSTMAMLLGSVPAAFADEAVTPAAAPAAQEVQAASGVVTPLATLYGSVGTPTTDIYFNGVYTVEIQGEPGGNYVIYAIDPSNNWYYRTEIIGSGKYTSQLWGYHKIYVTSSFGGNFKVIY
ncbi:hypothetical protein [Paenibacillus sp. FSL M7-1046]|uniref:hypothetical protein n=1 Tax=Paenibacillus sp. FSL M7-1046 TaxID=2975315 RepID=UPI0030F99A7A